MEEDIIKKAEQIVYYSADKAIRTIDFIFNEYEHIFLNRGEIEIQIPHYLDYKQRKEIEKYYENPSVRVESFCIGSIEDYKKGKKGSCKTSFIFKKK